MRPIMYFAEDVLHFCVSCSACSIIFCNDGFFLSVNFNHYYSLTFLSLSPSHPSFVLHELQQQPNYWSFKVSAACLSVSVLFVCLCYSPLYCVCVCVCLCCGIASDSSGITGLSPRSSGSSNTQLTWHLLTLRALCVFVCVCCGACVGLRWQRRHGWRQLKLQLHLICRRRFSVDL